MTSMHVTTTVSVGEINMAGSGTDSEIKDKESSQYVHIQLVERAV